MTGCCLARRDFAEQFPQEADVQMMHRPAHGAIAAGTIVLIRTGWGSRWPDRARYLGTTKTGLAAVPELHFPGLHPEAAQLLIDRRVHAVGIDTPSMDYGQSTTFDVHQRLKNEFWWAKRPPPGKN